MDGFAAALASAGALGSAGLVASAAVDGLAGTLVSAGALDSAARLASAAALGSEGTPDLAAAPLSPSASAPEVGFASTGADAAEDTVAIEAASAAVESHPDTGDAERPRGVGTLSGGTRSSPPIVRGVLKDPCEDLGRPTLSGTKEEAGSIASALSPASRGRLPERAGGLRRTRTRIHSQVHRQRHNDAPHCEHRRRPQLLAHEHGTRESKRDQCERRKRDSRRA